MRIVKNPMYNPSKIQCADIEEYYKFHQTLPGYQKTPLHEVSKNVFVKDESSRLSSNSFKILGISSAMFEQISDACEQQFFDFVDLYSYCKDIDFTICTASDGNFGVSCAQFCKMLQLKSRIFIPKDTPLYYVNKIKEYNGTAVLIQGDYDDCVRKAMSFQSSVEKCMLILDTAVTEEQMRCAQQVMGGYRTLFCEIEELENFDYIFVQAGVGGLAVAAICSAMEYKNVKIVTVEPYYYNCIQESIEKNKRQEASGGHTIINGLKCKTISDAAWDILKCGVYAAVTVSDEECINAYTELCKDIQTGYTGACSYAGVLATKHLIAPSSKILCINTEKAIY